MHLKIIRAEFDAVRLSAVKPSDVRAWCAKLKAEGRADSYVYALHARLEELQGEEAEQAAKGLELPYEDWCDPLDE
ncbi:hypothetical protein [Janibacter sp. G56]|uniref:hypothetical protein n=1 Tax=Janibacter sp. G56 TaxID=3418717 RepID=UPI003D053F20